MIVEGKVGIKLMEGDQAKCVDGYITTPFPKIDLSSNKKAANTIKRVNEWLIFNAHNKALINKDEHVILMLKNIKNITTADKDMAEIYLFGV